MSKDLADLTDRQSIYDAIKSAERADGSKPTYALAIAISIEVNRLIKVNGSLEGDNAMLKALVDGSKQPHDLTDEELRSRVRSLLVRRLDDATLSAAEIAQLKDVFGLASKVDELDVTIAQFECKDCPKGATTQHVDTEHDAEEAD